MDGEFVNGWVYKEGKVVATMEALSNTICDTGDSGGDGYWGGEPPYNNPPVVKNSNNQLIIKEYETFNESDHFFKPVCTG